MLVRVLLFASLREAAGTAELSLPLPSDATVATVADALALAMPAQQALLERCAFAVNEEYATPDQAINEDDAVAVIPPVSGGV